MEEKNLQALNRWWKKFPASKKSRHPPRGKIKVRPLRGKEKCSEGDGDQSIIGDIPIRSNPKHYCWPLSYLRRPWKSRKLLFQNTSFYHRSWAITFPVYARSTRCSVQRVDRECNLIQINKIDWVYALGLAASYCSSSCHVWKLWFCLRRSRFQFECRALYTLRPNRQLCHFRNEPNLLLSKCWVIIRLILFPR